MLLLFSIFGLAIFVNGFNVVTHKSPSTRLFARKTVSVPPGSIRETERENFITTKSNEIIAFTGALEGKEELIAEAVKKKREKKEKVQKVSARNATGFIFEDDGGVYDVPIISEPVWFRLLVRKGSERKFYELFMKLCNHSVWGDVVAGAYYPVRYYPKMKGKSIILATKPTVPGVVYIKTKMGPEVADAIEGMDGVRGFVKAFAGLVLPLTDQEEAEIEIMQAQPETLLDPKYEMIRKDGYVSIVSGYHKGKYGIFNGIKDERCDVLLRGAHSDQVENFPLEEVEYLEQPPEVKWNEMTAKEAVEALMAKDKRSPIIAQLRNEGLLTQILYPERFGSGAASHKLDKFERDQMSAGAMGGKRERSIALDKNKGKPAPSKAADKWLDPFNDSEESSRYDTDNARRAGGVGKKWDPVLGVLPLESSNNDGGGGGGNNNEKPWKKKSSFSDSYSNDRFDRFDTGNDRGGSRSSSYRDSGYNGKDAYGSQMRREGGDTFDSLIAGLIDGMDTERREIGSRQDSSSTARKPERRDTRNSRGDPYSGVGYGGYDKGFDKGVGKSSKLDEDSGRILDDLLKDLERSKLAKKKKDSPSDMTAAYDDGNDLDDILRRATSPTESPPPRNKRSKPAYTSTSDDVDNPPPKMADFDSFEVYLDALVNHEASKKGMAAGSGDSYFQSKGFSNAGNSAGDDDNDFDAELLSLLGEVDDIGAQGYAQESTKPREWTPKSRKSPSQPSQPQQTSSTPAWRRVSSPPVLQESPTGDLQDFEEFLASYDKDPGTSSRSSTSKSSSSQSISSSSDSDINRNSISNSNSNRDSSTDARVPSTDPPGTSTLNSSLIALSLKDLKDACREKGLPVSGTKAQLIDRLQS